MYANYPNPNPAATPATNPMYANYPNPNPATNPAYGNYPAPNPVTNNYPNPNPATNPAYSNYPNPNPATNPAYGNYPAPNPVTSNYPNPNPATNPAYSNYPGPAPAPQPGSNPSGNAVTVINYAGVNAWWYAVAVVAPEGVGVSSLQMKDSKMTQYETGYWQYDYYYDCDAFQFYYNSPYSPPFSFIATLTNGQQVQGYNVINSLYDGDSGSMSMSGAFTAEDEAATRSETQSQVSTEGLIAMVTISILLCCLMSTLCFVCHRRKNKVLAAGVEMEDDVMQKSDGGYDMTSIGDGHNVVTGNTGDDEQAIMVDAQVTETVH